MNVPGRSGDGLEYKEVDLNIAVEKVCKVVKAQQHPVILVGHSQGGALATQATAVCPEFIRAIIYVAAVVPLNGETAFDGLSESTNENFGKCVVPDATDKVFRLVEDKEVLEKTFLPDVRRDNPSLAKLAISSMVNEPMLIGTMPLKFPQNIYNLIPKFYIKTTKDNVVDPANQDEYISKVEIKRVFAMDTSHSPFLSDPSKLAEHLIEIAGMTEPTPNSGANIEVVKSYFKALQTGNMNLLASLLSDEIVWNQPGQGELSGKYEGKKKVFELFEKFMAISKGSFKIDTVTNYMSNGDFVTATLHFSAHNEQRSIAMNGIDLMKVVDGKIAEVFLFSSDQKAEDEFWVSN
jgi:pimeloyl-ACP methyl ester carboxylesterase/ketosteroid isomerase-like protein